MEDVEQAMAEAGDETCLLSLWALGERWHVLSVTVNVQKEFLGDEAGEALIKLRPEEHGESMWATEKRVGNGTTAEGRRLEFVSKAAWRVIMVGFKLRAKLDSSTAPSS